MINQRPPAQLLFMRRPSTYEPVLYHPMTSVLDVLPTGQTVGQVGSSVEAVEYRGIASLKFDASTENDTYFSIPYFGNYTRHTTHGAGWVATASLWMAKYNIGSSGTVAFLSFGHAFNAGINGKFMFNKRVISSTVTFCAEIVRGATYDRVALFTGGDTNWHHIAMLMHIAENDFSARMSVYLDGVSLGDVAGSKLFIRDEFDRVQIGIHQSSTHTGGVYISALRVWDRILTASEIYSLAHEFTPTSA